MYWTSNDRHFSGKFRRAGKISPQGVALVVLIFSVSMTISAYRSLRREFSGVVITKTQDSGFSNSYWIYLVSQESITAASSTAALQKLVTETPKRRVGVSRLVYGDVRSLQTVSKEAFSPFIYVEEDRHLDLGLQWLLWGIVGMIASLFIFRLAGTRETETPSERGLLLEE